MSCWTRFSILALTSSHLMFGTLISTGAVPQFGNGLGNVHTLLTVSSPGNSNTESGCVGWNGSASVTSAAVCPGGFTGGNNLAINNTHTTTSLGLNNFNSLQLILNASEPAGNSIIVSNLALTLFDQTGTLLASLSLAAPITFNQTFAGTGNAGFGFQLDTAQVALANTFLNVSGLRIGGALTALSATGGVETLFVRTFSNGGVPPIEVIPPIVIGPNEVPEPVTYAEIGAALVGLVVLRRKMACLA